MKCGNPTNLNDMWYMFSNNVSWLLIDDCVATVVLTHTDIYVQSIWIAIWFVLISEILQISKQYEMHGMQKQNLH